MSETRPLTPLETNIYEAGRRSVLDSEEMKAKDAVIEAVEKWATYLQATLAADRADMYDPAANRELCSAIVAALADLEGGE